MARKDVQNALAALHRALEAEPEDDSPWLLDVWAHYWEAEGRHLRSARDVDSCWRRARPHLADCRVADLTPERIEAYRARRLAMPTRRGGAPSPATLNREVAVVRRALAWACETGGLQTNPLAHVRLLAEDGIRRGKIASDDDLAKLLAACDGPDLRALVLLCHDSGMRSGEALGLRWDAIYARNGRGYTQLAQTKTGEPRLVRFSSRAWDALQLLDRETDYVFGSLKTGKPLAGSYVRKRFCLAVAEAGLQRTGRYRLTLHSLRHSFAYAARTRWRLSETTTMRLGGWKTPSAFRRYGIVDDAEADQAYESIDSRIELQRRGDRRAPRRAEGEAAQAPASEATSKKVAPEG